ncbi:peptidase S10 [Verrucomicrobiaceae bacterium R5-34]|uniref:Peptidase S10 n=1 Tax=Oceaniferula flava TaxID=2800421 RepID=A0AAE2VD18_9BACT|nr:peptidase S10 [Oceaniferula flavus]MBK1831670.1 peptidase S10 [Verrucomicrobiaceae bacterium R5-34]MBK1853994.1 peptidase S10 [Oceaniferula flavus]MBM1135300.1 peptidase S10 [Oceaniferula flavus]
MKSSIFSRVYRPAAVAVMSLSVTLAGVASAQDGKAAKKPAKGEKKEEKKVVSKQASVTIAGKKIDYTVTSSRLVLKTDDGKARAAVFHVAYTRNDVKDLSKRPVLFAFNGGPGSSAVWLHIGALGPRILPTSPDGTTALAPPITVGENPHSILDVADLVFIDPVSTGYSRAEEKKEQFHGVDGDIRSVGDFIRRWVTENKRWGSPKYLLGESYGGVRAAGLSHELQSRYGMSLNGVVMLSSLVDFRTLNPSNGDDLAYIAYLPSYTAVAHYHGKIQGDRDALVKEAEAFAKGAYATALLKGHALAADERQKIAAKLSELTSLSEELILRYDLRIYPSRFRKDLLRKEGKVLGRFDARTAWPIADKADDVASYDPSFSVAIGGFSTAMLDYLGNGLGWMDERPYEILARVRPWDWGQKNSVVNLSSRLAVAMRDNPHLRVLIQCGHSDLATPAGGILHSFDHLNIAPSLRKNISVEWYEAGHMFYLNQPDLEKMRKDLVKFIENE